MKKYILPLIIFLLAQVVSAEPVMIASDSFESGTYSGGVGWTGNWQTTGSTYPYYGSHDSGTWSAFLNGQASITRQVDTTGYSNVNLSFWVWSVATPISVNYTIDGVETNLVTINNVLPFTRYEYILPAGVTDIKFNNDAVSSVSYVDDIQIMGEVGVTPEVFLTLGNSYVVGSNVQISMSSTQTDTLHTLQLSYPNGTIFCQKNLLSPSVSQTSFNTICQLPDEQVVDAKAYLFVANDETINVTDFFNVVNLDNDPTMLDIQNVYFSQQVLQGGSTEIFTLIDTELNISNIRVELTFPDDTQRIIPMYETQNPNEYRAFITDTYRVGNTSFKIIVESNANYAEYENQYVVARYSTDFVDVVQDVRRILEPTIEVHGTEYRALDPGRMFIQLLDGYNAPITDGHCYLSIYYPDNTPFKYKQQMTYVDEGLYFLDFITPYMNGVYMASSYCVVEDTILNEVHAYDGFEGGYVIDNFDTAVDTNWIEESPLTANYITWDVFEGTGSMRVQAGSGSDGKKVTRTYATPENYSGATKFSYYLKGSTTANEWALQLVDSDGNILQSTDSPAQASFTKVNINVGDMTEINGTFNLEEVVEISFVADYLGSYADNKFDLLQWDDQTIWDGEWTLNGAVISTAQTYAGDYSLLQANDDDPTRDIFSDTNYTSLTVSFYHRTENMELNEYYYVYVEDASGTDYLLLSVTDGDDDGVWKYTTRTFDAVTDSFDFNGTLRFYVDSSGNTEADDLLYIDEINLMFSETIEVNETDYQVVRGSGEVHVTSDGSFIAELSQGELYYENFYEGFRQYYTIYSQVYTDTQEVEISVPIYEPFPCDHVLGVQIYNETSGDWDNVTDVKYEYNNNGRNRCNLQFDMDLETLETYQVRTDSENYWKQKILGDYQDNILLNDLMEIGCINYQQANGFDNYTVPVYNQSTYNDSLYLSCLGFFNSFYHYEEHITSNFLPLISAETNFTADQMNYLEASFLHIEDAGHEVRQYGTTILNGWNLGNSYSLAILSDPYPPDNPLWATHFANISTSALLYYNSVGGQANILSVLDGINESINELNVTVGNISLETPIVMIGGTEYGYGDEGLVAVRLSKAIDGGQTLITGATCDTTILNPDTTMFVNSASMSEYGSGIYYYNFTVPSVDGVYIYSVDCSEGGKDYFSMNTFHVSNKTLNDTDILDYISNVNSTLQNNFSTVYDNQDDIISKLQGNFTTIYNYLIGLNLSVYNLTGQILDDTNQLLIDVNSINITTLSAELEVLKTLIEENYDFNKEAVFLITDSVVRAERIQEMSSPEEIEAELLYIRENLERLDLTKKAGFFEQITQDINTKETIIFIALVLIISGIVSVLVVKRKSKLGKNKHEDKNEHSLIDSNLLD